MKKFVFAVFACMAMTFMACGNQTTANVEGADTDTVVVDSLDSIAADSIPVDSVDAAC